ncbi:hypothetical protein COCOBI_10-3250 [Coccomyxa sp. Obi]|nr:hypothetical protein COCOBI_10-3250 [Coccomyxa sp. Obi]
MELETYRVFTAEQEFKYASETFLQAQTRKWLSQVLRQPLPDTSLATLLTSGRVLGHVADIVLAHIFRRSIPQRITHQDFKERRYSAMLDDLNRFQEACKVLGFRQDDLIATSDVLTGKNITATCHALWNLATACVDQGVKGIPEFASRAEQAQLRADCMSRSRSYEKALRLTTAIAHSVQCQPKKSNLSRALYLEYIPAVKPAGIDSAYSSPTGKDTDSAFQLALGDAPAISPARSPPSDRSALDLPVAAATPPISDARPRPPSAGSRPSSAGFRLPKGSRPGSATSTCSSSSCGATSPLGLKLPLPKEVTHQAWAVDCSSYKGLPLRPQPIMRPRTPDISKAQAAKGRSFLGSCKDALPGVAGSIIAIAAMVLIGRGCSAPPDAANTPAHDSQEAEGEVAATREDQLWVVGRA